MPWNKFKQDKHNSQGWSKRFQAYIHTQHSANQSSNKTLAITTYKACKLLEECNGKKDSGKAKYLHEKVWKITLIIASVPWHHLQRHLWVPHQYSATTSREHSHLVWRSLSVVSAPISLPARSMKVLFPTTFPGNSLASSFLRLVSFTSKRVSFQQVVR